MDLLAYLAVAAASVFAAYLLLVRLGHRRVALACFVVMFALKLVAILFLDVEPFGEPSTWRDGTPLPAWLLGLSLFNQYGAWGAFGAWLQLRRRPQPARVDTAAPTT